MGVQAGSLLPLWLHEGLAVYGADQGEEMVRYYVGRRQKKDADDLLNGLEGPHSAIHYMEDYLAIKYIHDKHGVTSLQNFVREVISSKGDVRNAVQYTCFEDWDSFLANARKFSEEEIEMVQRTDRHLKHGAY
jgi:hypothetical protein